MSLTENKEKESSLEDHLLTDDETRVERRERARFDYEIRKTLDLYERATGETGKRMLRPLYQTDLVLDFDTKGNTIDIDERKSVEHAIREYVEFLHKKAEEDGKINIFEGTTNEKWWNTHGCNLTHIDYVAMDIRTRKYFTGTIEVKPYIISEGTPVN